VRGWQDASKGRILWSNMWACRHNLLWMIAQTVANTILIMVIKLATKKIYAPLNHPGRNTASTISATSMVSLIK
jgi:hypothetical protein